MKLKSLFNSLVSKVKSIFVLQFQVFKTFKQFENDKQLIEANLLYSGCLLLYLNGKRIPKVKKVFVKPIKNDKKITFMAIGFFQKKTIEIDVEPVFIITSKLKSQITVGKEDAVLKMKKIKLKQSNQLENKVEFDIKSKNIQSKLSNNSIASKRSSLVKTRLDQPMLKPNNFNLKDILTNQ